MIYIIFTLIILSIGGILFFTNKTTPGKKTRDQLLKELENYFESTFEPIAEYNDSYKIHFNFEGRQFIYEDILSPGFKALVNCTTLKGLTNTFFTLEFSEKERTRFLKKDDERKGSENKETKIILPRQLEQFSASSNNPEMANVILKDPTLVRVFTEFKNVDTRGRPLITIKIINGIVILDFDPSGRCHPKPISQLLGLESLEDYLDKMIIVMRKIEACLT